MRYGQIRKYDTANGDGIRTTIFITGCTHKCDGCFNKEYQSFESGQEWTEAQTNEIIENLKDSNVSGLSILGGEPFQNADGLLEVVLAVKKAGIQKDIWIWSGYTYEVLLELGKKDRAILDLLNECNVLIDGRFEESLKDLSLKYRGSSNQRVIDLDEIRNG